MNKTEYRKQMNESLIGLCFGFSKVQDDPDAKFYAGVFFGVTACLKALDGDPIAARTLREYAEGNVTLKGMPVIPSGT